MAVELKDKFEKAAKDIKALSKRPDNQTLLALYSFFKQATEGDASGQRPGIFDPVGRKKFDAWAERKDTPPETAMAEYVQLVNELLAQ